MEEIIEKQEVENTLPCSNKKYIIKRGNAGSAVRAQVVSKTTNLVNIGIPFVCALIAELVEIEGEKVVYEDVLNMDMVDVLHLGGKILGNFFPLVLK